MSKIKRFWSYLKALLGIGKDKREDPKLLLVQAQQEMREMHAKNRERAVHAITRKNHWQQMADDTQKTIDNLQARADLALQQGDDALAERILKEKQGLEDTLSATLENLQTAIETSDAIKNAIKSEDERIREKTREALRLKEQWRASQMPLLPAGILPKPHPEKPRLTTRGLLILNVVLLVFLALLLVLNRQTS